MNALTSPMAIRIALVVGVFLFALCIFAFSYAIARFRQNVSKGQEPSEKTGGSLLSPDSLAFATFQHAIRDLKEKQQEWETRARAEMKRANSEASISRALIENLPIPAISFNTVGLVQHANPEARQLFGYASLTGFSLKDLFGETIIGSKEVPSVLVRDILRQALSADAPLKNFQVTCDTRTETCVALNLIVVPGSDGTGVLLLQRLNQQSEGACTDEVPPPPENVCSKEDEER